MNELLKKMLINNLYFKNEQYYLIIFANQKTIENHNIE